MDSSGFLFSTLTLPGKCLSFLSEERAVLGMNLPELTLGWKDKRKTIVKANTEIILISKGEDFSKKSFCNLSFLLLQAGKCILSAPAWLQQTCSGASHGAQERPFVWAD